MNASIPNLVLQSFFKLDYIDIITHFLFVPIQIQKHLDWFKRTKKAI